MFYRGELTHDYEHEDTTITDLLLNNYRLRRKCDLLLKLFLTTKLVHGSRNETHQKTFIDIFKYYVCYAKTKKFWKNGYTINGLLVETSIDLKILHKINNVDPGFTIDNHPTTGIWITLSEDICTCDGDDYDNLFLYNKNKLAI
jgi:hypothetical protein